VRPPRRGNLAGCKNPGKVDAISLLFLGASNLWYTVIAAESPRMEAHGLEPEKALTSATLKQSRRRGQYETSHWVSCVSLIVE
jgi:hypothetical protein